MPTVEDQVLPDDITNVSHVAPWDLRSIPKRGVEAKVHGAKEVKEDELEQPRHPGEEPELQVAQALIDAVILLRNHGPVEYLDVDEITLSILE